MTNFCTLFDHNYLSRALVLYESLLRHCSDSFTLYVLAMDGDAYDWLSKNAPEHIVVQSLDDIRAQYPVLGRLQQERTRAEFSWTLSSFSIQFFLKKYALESVTYLDSDLCFYGDPKVLFDELSGESVIITPHNYTPCYDQTATSGRYCVQFMYFKNDAAGNEVLEWWRASCEECCCGTPTNGKFGDQKYLDDWLSRFAGKIHEERHSGCGLAPWNVQQFDIFKENERFIIQNKITKIKEELIFFHFHGLREFLMEDGKLIWKLNDYELSDSAIEHLYKPYVALLKKYAEKLPKQNLQTLDKKELPKKLTFSVLILRTMKRCVKNFIKSFLFFRTMRQIQIEREEENQRKRKFL